MPDYKPDPLDYGVAALIGGVFIVLKLCGLPLLPCCCISCADGEADEILDPRL